MTPAFSHRALIALLAVHTSALAALALILSLMVAGYGETGTADALAIAAPCIALLYALAMATYLVTARLLRQGRHSAVIGWLFGYACVPLPMLAAMLL
ncbi:MULTISPECIES: hypothetical protein [unclassified Lysobacter]|uniref:hypothetical protein n=1 Tax=unclassified Lysobacter TaxID=2635362 RepID=UPI001C23769D|nr:hypothetical protein [Lysobacter sp. MMG2]MBU8975929.1 hypothetical protein [Lysobacter sp. MMG2]